MKISLFLTYVTAKPFAQALALLLVAHLAKQPKIRGKRFRGKASNTPERQSGAEERPVHFGMKRYAIDA